MRINNKLFFIKLYVVLVILSIIAVFVACTLSIIFLNLMKFDEIEIRSLFDENYKNIIIGGIIIGSAALIMELIQRNIFYKKSISAIKILSESGYYTTINSTISISELHNNAIYLIGQVSYYNYIPLSSNLNVIRKKLERLIFKRKVKNLVINLIHSSIDIEQLKKIMSRDFYFELDNLLVINRFDQIVRLK